jgi:hypothetical protein
MMQNLWGKEFTPYESPRIQIVVQCLEAQQIHVDMPVSVARKFQGAGSVKQALKAQLEPAVVTELLAHHGLLESAALSNRSPDSMHQPCQRACPREGHPERQSMSGTADTDGDSFSDTALHFDRHAVRYCDGFLEDPPCAPAPIRALKDDFTGEPSGVHLMAWSLRNTIQADRLWSVKNLGSTYSTQMPWQILDFQ